MKKTSKTKTRYFIFFYEGYIGTSLYRPGGSFSGSMPVSGDTFPSRDIIIDIIIKKIEEEDLTASSISVNITNILEMKEKDYKAFWGIE